MKYFNLLLKSIIYHHFPMNFNFFKIYKLKKLITHKSNSKNLHPNYNIFFIYFKEGSFYSFFNSK